VKTSFIIPNRSTARAICDYTVVPPPRQLTEKNALQILKMIQHKKLNLRHPVRN